MFAVSTKHTISLSMHKVWQMTNADKSDPAPGTSTPRVKVTPSTVARTEQTNQFIRETGRLDMCS